MGNVRERNHCTSEWSNGVWSVIFHFSQTRAKVSLSLQSLFLSRSIPFWLRFVFTHSSNPGDYSSNLYHPLYLPRFLFHFLSIFFEDTQPRMGVDGSACYFSGYLHSEAEEKRKWLFTLGISLSPFILVVFLEFIRI